MASNIAALYVQKGGAYFGLDGIDPWDEARDARLYAGPWPVVAHPPCNRWCALAPANEARYGHKVGDDGGCFASALAAVRKWGGVLEHPAYTFAWKAHGLQRPNKEGWSQAPCGGWVCQVAQRNYGHRARKRTWLYVYGTRPQDLVWGDGPEPEAQISRDQRGAERNRVTVSKAEALASPVAFRDTLIAIARSVQK